jgi:DNA-binding CsgD family transcriptional regulator/tetratricopeptide (TPR) repeat protein
MCLARGDRSRPWPPRCRADQQDLSRLGTCSNPTDGPGSWAGHLVLSLDDAVAAWWQQCWAIDMVSGRCCDGGMTELPALVGRRVVLAGLVDALVGRGDRSTVVVAGEAGIGKSRLTAEAMASASREGVLVLVGHCLPLTDQLPLLPVQHILRALADLGDGIMLDVLRGCPPLVRDEIQLLVPSLPGGVAPAREPDADHGWRRRQLYDAVRLVLVEVSRRRPLAMVVEDVHWADPSTLDLLEYLLTPGAATTIPLIATWRTGETAVGPIDVWLGWLRRQPRVAFEELTPLDLEETAAQVSGILGQPLSSAEISRVFARSEGNPLFTEQLATFLHSAPGAAVGPARVGLPNGLRDLLLARVAQVCGTAIEVMACLAVAGRALDEALLSSCCSMEVAQVRSALRALAGRRLLAAPQESGGFRLRHALLAEAVRGALLPGELRDWHQRVAETLIAADELVAPAEIAEHYGAAGDRVRELPWRVRAGQRAEELYAFPQAAYQWLRALDAMEGLTAPALPDGVPAHLVYAAASEALESVGRQVEAGAVAERGLRHLLAGADPPAAADLLMRVGHYRGIVDRPAGRVAVTEALRLFESLPPSPGYFRAVAYYAGMAIEGEDLEATVALLDRALAIIDHVERPLHSGDLFRRRAWMYMCEGDSERALQLMDISWRLIAAARDPRGRIDHTAFHTDVLLKLGRPREVIEVAERADLAGWTLSGRPETHFTAVLRSNVFEAWTMLGQTEAAASSVEPFITGDPTRDTVALNIDQAILALLRGDLTGAEEGWAGLGAVIVAGSETHHDSERWRTELELWQHRPDAALHRALRVLEGVAHTSYSALSGPLLVLAMRGFADLCQPRSPSEPPVDTSLGVRLQRAHEDMRHDPFVAGPLRVIAEADQLAWDAEWARARGKATADLWDCVASGYEQATRPHQAGYSRWRQAETLLADRVMKTRAPPVLRDALYLATGHAPLLHAIADLATRARIDLAAPQLSAPSAAVPFGLTTRELAVLQLLGQGRSNAQVGTELFISPKTASVHVSNILRKMQVPTRVAAAGLAAQIGLLESGRD